MKNRKQSTVALILLLVFMALSLGAGQRIDASYSIESYAFDSSPKSLVISYYSNIYSRGFAWYTDEQTEQTLLYVAEGLHENNYDFEHLALDCSKNASSQVVYDASIPSPKVRSHKAYVEGLLPATNYTYKLGGDGQYVYGTFQTETDESVVTMLNFNDAQTKDPTKLNYWENTIATAFNALEGSDIDFVYNGGDLYDHNMTATSYSRFLRWGVSVDTLKSYSGTLPTMFITGNHDSLTKDLYPSGNCINFAGISSNNAGAYYSFNYGSVHFSMLGYISSSNKADFEAQMNWLERDLKAADENADIKWKVIGMHWGPYTTGDHGVEAATLTLAQKMTPLCSKYHVDLVMQAHDHTYSKTLPYKWDNAGYTTVESEIASVVELNPATIEIAGTNYDASGSGTYYVSCGSAGHRIGENIDYAAPNGKYLQSPVRIAVGKVAIDSPYLSTGSDATSDLDQTMFGVLKISGNVLEYDFYVASEDGEAIPVDTMRIFKGEDEDVEKVNAFLSKVEGHKNDIYALVEDYKAYLSFSTTIKALIPKQTIEYLQNCEVKSILVSSDKDAKVAVAALHYSDSADGKMNLRIVGEMNKANTSCGFIINYEKNGKQGNMKVQCSEVYTSSVCPSIENGILAKHNATSSKLLFAITITGAPDDGIVYEIIPYATLENGSLVFGQSVLVKAENGSLQTI